MSFGRGVIFEYVHKVVNLAILLASSSDFDYLFRKPLQIYLLYCASLSLHISSAIRYPHFLSFLLMTSINLSQVPIAQCILFHQ